MARYHPDIRIIDDPDALRVIANPLRLRLIELLRQKPRTATELADILDQPRTKLYYHLNLLEKHQIIEVEDTHLVSGIVERSYRVTAYRLSVDKRLLGTSAADGSPLDVYLSFVFDEVVTEIRRSLAAGLMEISGDSRRALAPPLLEPGRTWIRLTKEEAMEFRQRLQDMLDAYRHRLVLHPDEDPAEIEDPDQVTLYEFLAGFYPIVSPENPDTDES